MVAQVTPFVLGVVALALTLGVRAASSNRLVRNKLRLSLVLFGAHLGLILLRDWWLLAGDGSARAAMAARIESIDHLVSALAIINLAVVLLINPLREDRVPDRFPNILQDTIIIGLFVLVATFVMHEKLLTTSAVGAVVVGLALQDTLGNMFAGLAIQIEKPFRVGHWVSVGGFEGAVTEITWRATKLRTKTGNLVVMPNNVVSKEAIVNYSQPALPTRLQVEVGVSYDVPPNEVKAALLGAVETVDGVLPQPAPDVIVADFASSSILYRIRFWTHDFARDGPLCDRVRTAVYYVLRRNGMEIPFPIQIEYRRTEAPVRSPERERQLASILAGVDLFAPLSESDRSDLLSLSRELVYAAGERIVEQGGEGDSLFVVCKGRVRVTIDPGARQVAETGEGGYFGEMSLLTGEPRTATVTAAGDSSVLEITAATLRRVAMNDPLVLERMALVVAERREGLARTLEAAAGPGPIAGVVQAGFLARVQRFLRLPGSS